MSNVAEQALLMRLYQGKCAQLATASVHSLRYWVLRLEAEALLAELSVSG